MIESALKFCLVTQPDYRSFDQYLQFLENAIKGGLTSVQLRDKTHPLSKASEASIRIKKILSSLQIPLIINDHVELAVEIDADGIHLGQGDMNPLEARAILGPKKIIGWSVESLDDVKRANQLDCLDYIAVSAVFRSKSKLNCKKIWGLQELKKAVVMSKHPVVGIGGINKNNIMDVFSQGASGVAVISAVHDHPNAFIAANELILQINRTEYNV